MHGAAGSTPNPGDSEQEGSHDERRGRRVARADKRDKQPAEKEKTDEEKYGEATEDAIPFSRSLGKAKGDTTKVQLNLYQNTYMPNTKISGSG